MAPYSSPAPSLRSIQYSAPIRSLVLSWASAQLLPAFSSPSRRTHGHGTRPVGLRVLRPRTAMVSSLPTRGRCRPESYERVLTHPDGHRASTSGPSDEVAGQGGTAALTGVSAVRRRRNRRPPRAASGPALVGRPAPAPGRS